MNVLLIEEKTGVCRPSDALLFRLARISHALLMSPERAGHKSPVREPWEGKGNDKSPERAKQAVPLFQGVHCTHPRIPGLTPQAFLFRPYGALTRREKSPPASFCRKTPEMDVRSGPGGAKASSRGRKPPDRKLHQIEPQQGRKSCLRYALSVAPSGLHISMPSNPGLAPGAICCRPYGTLGLRSRVSQQKLASRTWQSLLFVCALSASLTLCPLTASARQQEAKDTSSATGAAATSSGDIEAERASAAPVLVGGEPAIWIIAGIGPYTPESRAQRISERLSAIIRDRSIQDLKVTMVEVEGSLELRIGPRLVMVVTKKDAEAAGVAQERVAQEYARQLETAIQNERLRRAPATLIRSGIYAAVATVVLMSILWLVGRLARRLHRSLQKSRWLGSLRLQKVQIVSADSLRRWIRQVVFGFRILVTLVVLDLYLTYVLGLFPWTRAVSLKLFDYLLAPISAAGTAFLDYFPKLLFVIFITVLVILAIRLVGLFFSQIQNGRLVFADFPAEWADPTNKIVRVLLIAFGVVIAFPYLPASGSPAFAGVSVFMGILISLASSSSLSNMIAGLVLTYTGAFRLGDRVQIGNAYGDIQKTSLLATRIRTIKNEEITIPNSIVLGSSVINFSHKGRTAGLILHTTVTIGYDAPWRKVHDLLIRAAMETPGVLSEPRPFVWQTALNDFYVTYEINAYTDKPHDINDIYAVLHSRIQDSFYEAGVEIMSPHYSSLRDGNTVAIPEEFRGPGYRAPGFRVDSRESMPK